MTEFLSDKFHQTHVFSSFFYRRLTQKPSRRHKEEEDAECTRLALKQLRLWFDVPSIDSLCIRCRQCRRKINNSKNKTHCNAGFRIFHYENCLTKKTVYRRLFDIAELTVSPCP